MPKNTPATPSPGSGIGCLGPLRIALVDLESRLRDTVQNALVQVFLEVVDCRRPLLSVSAMHDAGWRVVFDDGAGKKMDKLVGVMPPEVYAQIADNLLEMEAA